VRVDNGGVVVVSTVRRWDVAVGCRLVIWDDLSVDDGRLRHFVVSIRVNVFRVFLFFTVVLMMLIPASHTALTVTTKLIGRIT